MPRPPWLSFRATVEESQPNGETIIPIPCPSYLSFRATVEESQPNGGTIIPMPSPSCLSFRATVEESQPNGETIIAICRPPVFVIPDLPRNPNRGEGTGHPTPKRRGPAPLVFHDCRSE